MGKAAKIIQVIDITYLMFFSLREVENKLVGISKKLFLHLDKKHAKLIKKKTEKKLSKKLLAVENVDTNLIDNEKESTKKVTLVEELVETVESEDFDDELDNVETSEDEDEIIEVAESEKKVAKKRKSNVLSENASSCSNGTPLLSGVSSFFNIKPNEDHETSSDDDDEVFY